MKQYYHVTYAVNLPGIASRGLVPGAGRGVSYQQSHLRVRGQMGVFLTTGKGIDYWMNYLAVGVGARTLATALPWVPVVLSVQVHKDVYLDALGKHDTGYAAFWTEAIPVHNIDVYAGQAGWLPVARYREKPIRTGLRRCGKVFDPEENEFSDRRTLLPAWCVLKSDTSPLLPTVLR